MVSRGPSAGLAPKPTQAPTTQPNGRAAIAERVRQGRLTLAGPLLMLVARTVLAYLAQALVAGVMALRGAPEPWRAATPWFTVSGTLVDLGTLGLLAWLAGREGLRLSELIGFDRRQLGRDLRLALGTLAIFLVVGLASGAATGIALYGANPPPRVMGPLPAWAAWYSVLVWPILWALAEQTTYNGYVAPRLQVLTGRTWLAVLITALGFGLQHLALPSVPDVRFSLYRFLPAFAIGLVMVPLYLRTRRLPALIFAHWFVDVLSPVMQIILVGE